MRRIYVTVLVHPTARQGYENWLAQQPQNPGHDPAMMTVAELGLHGALQQATGQPGVPNHHTDGTSYYYNHEGKTWFRYVYTDENEWFSSNTRRTVTIVGVLS